MFVKTERAIGWLALLASAMVIGMLAIFVATGVGQDPLQYVHPPEEYRALLLRGPAALRATLGLDNLFLVFYATLFVLLGRVIERAGADPRLCRTAVGLLLALALLDLVENCHFLVMLAGAEQGLTPSRTEIAAQVLESLLKFHVSYLGLFLLAFSIPRATAAARLLSSLSLGLQLPVGVLIYVTPSSVALPLVFGRFGYFLAALALAGWAFGRTGPGPAPASAAGALRPEVGPAAAG